MKLWRYGRAIERLGDRYTLIKLLGSGGMADVCLAWDQKRGQDVAIKLMKPEEVRQRSLNSFLREAGRVANWDHPHIIRIEGNFRLELLDPARGIVVPYIVMEYAQGGDLHTRLTPGQPYPLQDSLDIFHQLCLAVDYAHRQGVVHRDLKPLNILFRVLPDSSEQAVISDFGLAVEMKTTQHSVVGGGTLAYMAPEQFLGQVGPAGDIFALGVILYQLCTGRLPFRRSMQNIRTLDTRLPRRADTFNSALPEGFDAILLTALAGQPDARFPSAIDFWEQVKALDWQQKVYVSAPVPSVTQTLVQKGTPPRIMQATNKEPRTIHIGGDQELDATPPIIRAPVAHKARQTPGQKGTPRRHPVMHLFRWPVALVSPFLILLLLLLVHFSGFAFSSGAGGQPASRATVTLGRASIPETGTFSLPSTIDAPDSPQNMLRLRVLSATSPLVTQRILGTGKTRQPATAASGLIELFNHIDLPQTIDAGTIITGQNGIQVKLLETVTVQAAPSDPTSANTGTALVHAQALLPGAKGNIAANTLQRTDCCGNPFVDAVSNSAFTGGADGNAYTYVTQQDKDQVVATLSQQLRAPTLDALTQQLHPGEQITAPPTCTTTSPTDDPVGDTGSERAGTTVHVSTICQDMAYNQDALQTQGTRLLMAQAQHDPTITGYQVVGVIHTQITQVERSASAQNQVVVHIHAQGTWLAVISDAHKLALARAIAGRSLDQAQTILSSTPGIQSAHILLQGGTALPTNPTAIQIQIAAAS